MSGGEVRGEWKNLKSTRCILRTTRTDQHLGRPWLSLEFVGFAIGHGLGIYIPAGDGAVKGKNAESRFEDMNRFFANLHLVLVTVRLVRPRCHGQDPEPA